MIEHVHKHIIAELHQNTRTDIIFIITAIFLNLIALGINSAMAGNSRDEVDLFVVMFIVVALVSGKIMEPIAPSSLIWIKV